jgi:hypothetical protein
VNRVRLRRIALVAGVLTLLAALALVSTRRVRTTFSLAATTQLVVFEASDRHRSPWHLQRATLFRPAREEEPGGEEDFSGTLVVNPGTKVVVERIGTRTVRILLERPRAAGAAGLLRARGGGRSRVAGDGLVLTGEPSTLGGAAGLVLPLAGRISVGTEVGQDLGDEPALLLGGRVSLLAHTLLGSRRYDAGSAMLEFGDYPTVDALGDAYGLLRIGDDRDMEVQYRVVARSMRIDRFGSLGYEVYASLFDRIGNDHTVQAIWAAALFTLAWLGRGRKALARVREEGNEKA